ncbi:MAG: lipoate--protein ligase family protein [Firmicutes bacterium]|nr:lipoate--protein ligase family protein [Bacillota bacterium]
MCVLSARLVYLSPNAPSEELRLSPVLAETVARWCAAKEATAVVIRHQSPYVLLGPKDRRLPNLSHAVQWLESQGYPVFMRIGGGSAVLLDGDCLSFAVSRPCRDLTAWQDNFLTMSRGVIRALHALGIPAEFGRAAGSYCEGPYDLVVHGRKIAGIAQAIRGGFALVSGMLLVRQDPERTTHLLQEFYHRAGSPLRLEASAVTALHRFPGLAGVTLAQVEQALIDGFAADYALSPQPLSSAEKALAQQLLTERRLLA